MIGDMTSLSKLRNIKTRSISPENFSGEKGEGGQAVEGTGASCARDLGKGWKISPSVKIAPGETFTMAEMDGDSEYPTICGTGTEDYFCGSYDFEVDGIYCPYCTPYAGLSKITATDGAYKTQQRFNMYRWHINDPIYFDTDLRVTIQALGWRSGGRYLPLQDDISSVAYWYQDTPAPSGSVLGSRDDLEII